MQCALRAVLQTRAAPYARTSELPTTAAAGTSASAMISWRSNPRKLFTRVCCCCWHASEGARAQKRRANTCRKCTYNAAAPHWAWRCQVVLSCGTCNDHKRESQTNRTISLRAHAAVPLLSPGHYCSQVTRRMRISVLVLPLLRAPWPPGVVTEVTVIPRRCNICKARRHRTVSLAVHAVNRKLRMIASQGLAAGLGTQGCNASSAPRSD